MKVCIATVLTILGVLLFNAGASEVQDGIDRYFREEHLAALNRQLAASPNDTDILALIGQIQYTQHKLAEAEATLQRVLTLNPDHGLAHATLALVCSEQHDAASAIEHLRHAIRVQPDRDDYFFNLAVIYATDTPPNREAAQQVYRWSLRLGGGRDADLERLLH